MSASSDAVRATGIWKYHGDFPALRNISIAVSRGSCLALLGRNGAGKTTFLRILAGLSIASQGEIALLGTEPRSSAARLRIGYLGHGTGIYEELTARDNLLHFSHLYRVGDSRRAVATWLDRVGLTHVASGRASEFSRGMRQRLALARVFVHDPELLLLDEPFTSLDDRAVALLQELLVETRTRGRTAIISTHQLREALVLATDVALLDRGALVHHGPRTERMADDPASIYRENTR